MERTFEHSETSTEPRRCTNCGYYFQDSDEYVYREDMLGRRFYRCAYGCGCRQEIKHSNAEDSCVDRRNSLQISGDMVNTLHLFSAPHRRSYGGNAKLDM